MSWATDRLDALKAGTAEPPPVVRTLRMGTLDDWGPGWATKRWQPDPDVLNGDGSMFGGYIAALADQMLAFAAMSTLPEGQAFRTINLNIHFFRVGRAYPLTLESSVISQTRNIIAVEATILRAHDSALVAKAAAQQWLQPLPGRSA